MEKQTYCPLCEINNPNDDSRFRRKEKVPAPNTCNEQLDTTSGYNNSLPQQSKDSQISTNDSANASLQGSYGYGTYQSSGMGSANYVSSVVSTAFAPGSYLTNEDRRDLEKKRENNKLDIEKKQAEENIVVHAYKERKQIDEIHEYNKAATHPKLAYDPDGNLEYFFVDYLGNLKGSRQKLLNVKDFTAIKYKSEDPFGCEALAIAWEHCPADFIAFKLINECLAEDPVKFLKKLQRAGLTLNCSEDKKKVLVGLLMSWCLNTKDIYYVPFGHGWYWNSVKQSIDYYSDDKITFREVLSHVQ